MKVIIFLSLITSTLFFSDIIYSQEQINLSVLDSLLNVTTEETVITATRSERALSNVTVPTLQISGSSIVNAGQLKLNEVLQEQPGIMVTTTGGSSSIGGGVFGNGLMVQGMSPDFTLIMIDGEPIIGRQGGVLDLSRFTVGNISKIEIVKGPSSALYGSEAMAGVVNILTDQKRNDHAKLVARYGRFHMRDIFGSINKEIGKSSLYFFANYNASEGYDFTPDTKTRTIDPHHDFTFNTKWTHRFTPKTKLIWSNRFFKGYQTSDYFQNQGEFRISGSGITQDLNINPVLYHRWNDHAKSAFRFFGSSYKYGQDLKVFPTNEQYYRDDFTHNLYRFEHQTDLNISSRAEVIAGGGLIFQTVETARYSAAQHQKQFYIFSQGEWRSGQWIIIPGVRFDHNTDFASRFSPKISAQYKKSTTQTFNISLGSGFKAPDFRQLYLSYANPAAQGYRIFGVQEFSLEQINLDLQSGVVIDILSAAYEIKSLKPETSRSINIGYIQKLQNNRRIDANIFYNHVDNLINFVPIALQSNGTFVYSYKNISKAFTSGVEVNYFHSWNKNIDLSIGYQFLYTGEYQVLQNIFANKVFGRNSQYGSARLMQWYDYSGLLGRSPHLLNAKLQYHFPQKGVVGTLRANYRSRWGAIDLDGNNFANMREEYASGFLMINASIQKQFNKTITVQLNANNILNHKDEINTPQIPGFHLLGSIICNFLNN